MYIHVTKLIVHFFSQYLEDVGESKSTRKNKKRRSKKPNEGFEITSGEYIYIYIIIYIIYVVVIGFKNCGTMF